MDLTPIRLEFNVSVKIVCTIISIHLIRAILKIIFNIFYSLEKKKIN